MTNQLLKQLVQLPKKTFVIPAGYELATSLLILAIAKDFTGLLNHFYTKDITHIAETAPVLLALFLMLCLQTGINYRQQTFWKKISADMREHYRQLLHQQLPCSPTAPRDYSLLALETVDALDNLYTKILPLLTALLIRLPLLLTAMLVIDPLTALLFALTLPIAPFLLYLIGQATKKASQREWHHLEALTSGFHELLQGMVMLKLFRQDRHQREQLASLSQSFATASLTVLQLAFVSSFALELITTLSIALIAVSTGLRLLSDGLSFSTAFFVLLLAPKFYEPLRQGGLAFHAFMDAHTAWQKLQDILFDGVLASPTGHLEQLQIPPAVFLDALCYRYPSTPIAVIQQLTLTIPADRITLITGSSGSGKTTLLKLLAGLCQPDSGTISLNDHPLATMAEASRQKLIAYVPQEPHLFAANLRDNTCLFQSVPDERIRQALRLASLEKWYHALPQGLDTPLGQGGLPLSEGQRKRLGLARALLQNRPITLLDEPTAGMDEALEAQVLRAITVFSRHRTVIIVSHRPAVKDIADTIVELEPGGDPL